MLQQSESYRHNACGRCCAVLATVFPLDGPVGSLLLRDMSFPSVRTHFITPGWNYGGQVIDANEVVEVKND